LEPTIEAANVLVNFDLPWNPMIVEQRIGRIQRLASEHASVCIFNIILRGTFEEYIVGRLMEKTPDGRPCHRRH
jgi:SNF2 family DNA or RNA helicase